MLPYVPLAVNGWLNSIAKYSVRLLVASQNPVLVTEPVSSSPLTWLSVEAAYGVAGSSSLSSSVAAVVAGNVNWPIPARVVVVSATLVPLPSETE